MKLNKIFCFAISKLHHDFSSDMQNKKNVLKCIKVSEFRIFHDKMYVCYILLSFIFSNKGNFKCTSYAVLAKILKEKVYKQSSK